jgi:hypothetical protein
MILLQKHLGFCRPLLLSLFMAALLFCSAVSPAEAVINVSVAPGGSVDIMIDTFRPNTAFTYLAINGPFARGTTSRSSMSGISVDDWGSANFNASSSSNRVWSGEALRYTNDGTGLGTTVSVTGVWGNGFSSQAETVNISITNSGASVVSISMMDPSPTVAASVRWQVKFDQAVTGVNTGNFLLSGTLSGASITSVSGSGDTWVVTANTGTSTGIFGVNMVNSTGVNPQVLGLTFTGDSYSFQNFPTIVTEPANMTILSGQSATLTARVGSRTASASDPIKWQWYNAPVGTKSSPVCAQGSSSVSPTNISCTVGPLTSTPANGYWVDVWNNDPWHNTSMDGRVTVNHTPTLATNLGLLANKNSSLPLTTTRLQATDSDQDSSSLTYSITAGPGHGSLNRSTFTQWDLDNGLVTYTPATGYIGSDSFSFSLSDGQPAPGEGKLTGSVTITVNDVPTFIGSNTLSVLKNATATDIKGLLHVSDLDASQTETWTVTAAPGQGTLAGFPATASAASSDITPGGTITYQPTAGYVGNDSFTIQVSDGLATTSRTINVTVADPPAITGQPTNSAIYDSQNTSFTGAASGTGLSYQWQVNQGGGFANLTNGGVYSNVTATTMNITGATLAMNGYQYRLIVTGTYPPAATSNSATLTVMPVQEINVEGNAVTIVDGDVTPAATDHTDFGSAYITVGSVVRTFTIRNTGPVTLDVTSTDISGPQAGDFSVIAMPALTVAGSSSTTFQVKFIPTAAGARSATIAITNNDFDENPYNFTIMGTGVVPPTVATNAATAITSTGATLNGTLNAQNNSIAINFEYGLTSGYGSTVSATPASASGVSNTAASATLSGLAPATIYHFRVNAVDGAIITSGTDLQLLTRPAPPVATTATDIATTGFSANWGTVSGATSYFLTVATTMDFSSGILPTYPKDMGLATSATLTGLNPATTYYYRVTSANASGESAPSNVITQVTLSGRNTGVVVDSAAPLLLYAGFDGEGVYRSTDGGTSWLPTAGSVNKRIMAMVINPSNHARLYGATFGGGAIFSDDNGANWSSCTNTGLSGSGLNMASLAIDKNGNLVAATDAGLFSSSNCATWSTINTGLPAPAGMLVIDPVDPLQLTAGISGQGIYRSSNGGTSWTTASGQPGSLALQALVTSMANRTRLYAATYGSGVFLSSDSGDTWSSCTGQPVNQKVLSLTTDMTGKLYAGTEAGVFVSSDNCGTWTAIPSGLP